MSVVGVVSISLGLLIVVSRGFLTLFPAATLRWFEKSVLTESRTRLFGILLLPLAVLMIWSGAAQDSGLAGTLLIFGFFILIAAVPWLVFFPRTYIEFCSAFLPPEPGSSLVGWRVVGLLGMAIGAALIYFGALAL